MSVVLVTGGSGRLGQSVVRALAEAGHDVISVDHRITGELPAREISIDLRETTATRETFCVLAPDFVVHLAAIAVPGSLPDSEIFDINTSLLWSVLEASRAAGARGLLVASSPTVIGYGSPTGWTPQTLPIDEDHPVAPWNGYAASKVAIEEIIRMAVRRDGDGLRIGAFRPCFVIAPEEWSGAPTQQGHTLHDRIQNPALSAVALFNYLDARDAGEFVRLWIEQYATPPNGTIFFVGADDSLVDGPIAEALKQHVPQTHAVSELLHDNAPVFSSARATELLGWRPQHSWRHELDPYPTDHSPLDTSTEASNVHAQHS